MFLFYLLFLIRFLFIILFQQHIFLFHIYIFVFLAGTLTQNVGLSVIQHLSQHFILVDIQIAIVNEVVIQVIIVVIVLRLPRILIHMLLLLLLLNALSHRLFLLLLLFVHHFLLVPCIFLDRSQTVVEFYPCYHRLDKHVEATLLSVLV